MVLRSVARNVSTNDDYSNSNHVGLYTDNGKENASYYNIVVSMFFSIIPIIYRRVFFHQPSVVFCKYSPDSTSFLAVDAAS